MDVRFPVLVLLCQDISGERLHRLWTPQPFQKHALLHQRRALDLRSGTVPVPYREVELQSQMGAIDYAVLKLGHPSHPLGYEAFEYTTLTLPFRMSLENSPSCAGVGSRRIVCPGRRPGSPRPPPRAGSAPLPPDGLKAKSDSFI